MKTDLEILPELEVDLAIKKSQLRRFLTSKKSDDSQSEEKIALITMNNEIPSPITTQP